MCGYKPRRNWQLQKDENSSTVQQKMSLMYSNVPGSESADSSLKMMIGSPNFIGSVLACFLDNTIPGELCFKMWLYININTNIYIKK